MYAEVDPAHVEQPRTFFPGLVGMTEIPKPRELTGPGRVSVRCRGDLSPPGGRPELRTSTEGTSRVSRGRLCGLGGPTRERWLRREVGRQRRERRTVLPG